MRSDSYSKTSRIICQYCRGKPALADYTIADFTEANTITALFKIK